MKRGFSLIELLVVVAIIAILVGVATPYYADYVKESKRAKALQDLDVLKQAVVLFNSQEDLPYQGIIASSAPYFPILGENDFNGLMGRYLTYIPVDPWGKNYKLDPYACYAYSEGPDSRTEDDDIRDYYVKDLALNRIEWEDSNNNRQMDNPDKLFFHFNKPLWVQGNIQSTHFDVFENNQISTASFIIDTAFVGTDNPGYALVTATQSILIYRVGIANEVKLGVHTVALKDELLNVLQNYQEVSYDRITSTPTDLRTRVVYASDNITPVRYAIRTNPVKISPKNR